MARSPFATSIPRLPRRVTRRAVATAGTFGLAGLLARRAVATASAAVTPTASPEAGRVSLLFVQDCDSGGFAPKPGTPDAFTLTLRHSLGRTVYFSDRPQRFYGSLPTDDFVADAAFSPENPPNAALVIQVSATDAEIAVFELRNPHYDPIGHALTYEAVLLTDNANQGMRVSKTPLSEQALPATFGAASLFIDGERLNEKIYFYNKSGRNIRIIG